MAKSTSKSSKAAAFILYVVNLFVMVISALMFAFGMWIITSRDTLSGVVNTFGSTTLKTNFLAFHGFTVRVPDPSCDRERNFGSAWDLRFQVELVKMTSLCLMESSQWSPRVLDTILTARAMQHGDQHYDGLLRALLQDMLTLRVGIAVTAVATFLFFICFMGFYGAITKSPFLLFLYAALALLLLLLECALLYYFSSNLFEKGLQDDGQWTHAMRLMFRCCEHNISLPEERKPPWSCCGAEFYPNNCTTSHLYKKDCLTSIQDWLGRYQLLIYSSLAVLHIILASCSIIRRSCSLSSSYS